MFDFTILMSLASKISMLKGLSHLRKVVKYILIVCQNIENVLPNMFVFPPPPQKKKILRTLWGLEA